MSSQARTPLKVVFGTMTFGEAGREGARTHTIAECKQFLDTFQQHGHSEIDTARMYTSGQSEQWLGELDWQSRGLVMETKLYPSKGKPLAKLITSDEYDHSAGDVRKGLEDSLTALKADKIDMFYLHAPDRATPIEETMRAVNDLHKEGKFERFGVSNFMSWEVAQMCEIAKKNEWIQPTVYQGVYNGLQRSIEPELVPCLRKYGISLYAFQPLAGGFLTGRYARDQTEFEEGSRFDPKRGQGSVHRGRYLNDAFFDALDVVKPVADKNGLTLAECAMRWLSHHSSMKKEHGDAVIIGASSISHLEQNLVDLEKGSLPEDVVQAFDAAWAITRGAAKPYFH